MPLPSPPSFWPTCLWLWMALMSLCMLGCKAHECWHVQVCGPLCRRGGHCVLLINGECEQVHSSVDEFGVAMPPCPPEAWRACLLCPPVATTRLATCSEIKGTHRLHTSQCTYSTENMSHEITKSLQNSLQNFNPATSQCLRHFHLLLFTFQTVSHFNSSYHLKLFIFNRISLTYIIDF